MANSAGLGLVVLGRVVGVFAFDGDAQGAEEVYVVLGERSAVFRDFGSLGVLALFDFVEANGGFEHQEDVEPVLANVLHDTGDLFAFDDGLMDGFTELLDELAQARSHVFPPAATSAGKWRRAASDLITLLRERHSGNWHLALDARRRRDVRRCYHHIEVRPQTIGRVLGIGLRVAGRMAGHAIMGEDAQGTAGTAQQSAIPTAAARGRAAGQATRGASRGVSGFFKPFKSVGGKILLEVIGVFFLLPVVVFAPVLWRTRSSWQHGPDHRTFLAAAVVVVVFLYLGITSFWRARRRP
jgi:hypothetical protein